MRKEITITDADGPITTFDQAEYIGDDIVLYNNQTGSSTIDIINPSEISETLDMQIGFEQQPTDFTINVSSSANLYLTGFYYANGAPNIMNINTGAHSSLRLGENFISYNVPINIYMSEKSVVEFQNRDPSMISSNKVVEIHGLTSDNNIIVNDSSRIEYSEDYLNFYNENN